MRAIAVLVLVGCGELTGAAPYSEIGPGDTAPRDTAVGDSAPRNLNDIDGYYVDEPVPQTRAIFRLDRASDPTHPRIVIVSAAVAVTIPCDTFKLADWHTRMPAGAMIHVIELGAAGAGSFAVKKDTPPAVNGATVGRTFQNTGMFSLERAEKGTVTIAKSDVTSSQGSFEATYVVYYDPDPAPQPNPIKATFVAPACAVD